MIFVDTSAWFASVVPSDPDHADASHRLTQHAQPLVTTDYVVDETLTLLKVRREPTRALSLGEVFFSGGIATVYYLTGDDVRLAWQTFRRFADKGWSFTDCSSKVVIERLRLAQAFAFDHHFHQFGSVQVAP